MYEIFLDYVTEDLDNLDPNTRQLVITQIEKWATRVQFDRRTYPLAYSIAPVECPQYQGLLCLIDHRHRVIIAMQFRPKPV